MQLFKQMHWFTLWKPHKAKIYIWPLHFSAPKIVLFSIHGDRQRSHLPLFDGVGLGGDSANFVELMKQLKKKKNIINK